MSLGKSEIMDIITSLVKGALIGFNTTKKLWVVVILMGILNIILKKLYPKIRGYFGEKWIREELNKLPNEYRVLNNLMIKDERGTHQIDHIVVSKYGVFVIEMKNYFGTIYGSEYSLKWTQKVRKQKRKFNNPIHQNYGHIKALESLIGCSENDFISIICFSNQAKMKAKTTTLITQTNYIKAEILQYTEVKDFNPDEVYDKLIKINITDKKEIKNHVTNIKTKIKENESLENQMICPRCYGSLIERSGKYGPFIGCSNYPKCKFIKKI